MTSRSSSCRAPFTRHRLLGGKMAARHDWRMLRAEKARANDERPIHADSSDEHRDEHERNSTFKTKSDHS